MRVWRDWSCTVRVVLGDPEPGAEPGAEPVADRVADRVPDDVADGSEALVRELMGGVDRAVSRFRADSETERVNDAAPRLIPVGPLALTLVEVGLDAARRTHGAVDPTVGAQLVALGYDEDIAFVRARPTPATPGPGHPTVPGGGWAGVVVDRHLRRVGLPRGVRLDLGATAKAWTADEAARRVAARYRVPVLVEIGGDLAVAGTPRQPWSVRVAETEAGPGELVGLTRGGLATSSTAARRWRTAGGTAHHVLDPGTGRPVRGPVRTATVWAPSALEANTLSTAALVWGRDAAARLTRTGRPARLVDQLGRVRTVGAWPRPERAA